jgi:hypothetical protein
VYPALRVGWGDWRAWRAWLPAAGGGAWRVAAGGAVAVIVGSVLRLLAAMAMVLRNTGRTRRARVSERGGAGVAPVRSAVGNGAGEV